MHVSDTAHTENVEFNLPGITLSGLRSNSGKAHRIIALHGWLDNANSFLPLMPLMPDADIVSIDLPGHGLSTHLDAAAHYHFIDIVHSVFDVAERLGWDQFTLMGHSLGACIAPFAAVARPEPLNAIIMLEASGPLTESAEQVPERLKRSLTDRASRKLQSSRVFNDSKDAIDARLRATRMTRESAALIVERQLVKEENGYRWRFDPRHRMASPVYLVEEQVLAVLEQVGCPVLTVLADEGYLVTRPETKKRLECLKYATHQSVPGFHHMHMDTPEPTAMHINSFLAGLSSRQ